MVTAMSPAPCRRRRCCKATEGIEVTLQASLSYKGQSTGAHLSIRSAASLLRRDSPTYSPPSREQGRFKAQSAWVDEFHFPPAHMLRAILLPVHRRQRRILQRPLPLALRLLLLRPLLLPLSPRPWLPCRAPSLLPCRTGTEDCIVEGRCDIRYLGDEIRGRSLGRGRVAGAVG